MVNVDLLTQAMAAIKANPSQWDQSDWYMHTAKDGSRWWPGDYSTPEEATADHCGTSYCLAGWAAVLSGHKPPSEGLWYIDDKHVDVWAKDELGISSEKSDVLFHEDNTLEELDLLVAALIENPEISSNEFGNLVGRPGWDCNCGCKDDDDDDEEF